MRYLCGLLASSKHTVVFAGAGASTSAGNFHFNRISIGRSKNPVLGQNTCSKKRVTDFGGTPCTDKIRKVIWDDQKSSVPTRTSLPTKADSQV